MNVEDIKIGMDIIISKNIQRTDETFSSNANMLKMRGKIFKVRDIAGNEIYIHNGTYTYIFHPYDIMECRPPVIDIKQNDLNINIKPQLFDPKNLR